MAFLFYSIREGSYPIVFLLLFFFLKPYKLFLQLSGTMGFISTLLFYQCLLIRTNLIRIIFHIFIRCFFNFFNDFTPSHRKPSSTFLNQNRSVPVVLVCQKSCTHSKNLRLFSSVAFFHHSSVSQYCTLGNQKKK